MTKKEAIEKVELIRKMGAFDEGAHIEEDKLYLKFIECISNGVYKIEQAREIANIIKKTQDFDLYRFYG